MVKKKMQESENSNVQYFMICATIISVVALIAGAWGAEGFKWIGVGIAVLFVFLMYIAVLPKGAGF